jgi:arsenate reductase
VTKPAVLFVCTHNAARSQMAEALLRSRAGDYFDAYSAGSEPTQVHPLTVRVLEEIGIDASEQYAKPLKQYLGKLAIKYAIFVCKNAEERCPTLWPSALVRLSWPFDDPTAAAGSEEERLARFRAIRDQIDAKIASWLNELGIDNRLGAPNRRRNDVASSQ